MRADMKSSNNALIIYVDGCFMDGLGGGWMDRLGKWMDK